jgi:hypothetical protein
MMRILGWWAFGLGFSLLLGLLTGPLLDLIRGRLLQKARKKGEVIDDKDARLYLESLYLSSKLLGSIERLFFTTLVAFNVSGTATAMIAWIAIKMATDWQRILPRGAKLWVRSLAFSALLGNMISLLFALIGGLICCLGK